MDSREEKSYSGSASIGPQAPQSQVSTELNGLDSLVESLLRTVDKLGQRLQPVLRSRLPETEGNSKVAEEPVELARSLSSVRSRMNIALNDLYSINDRLEL